MDYESIRNINLAVTMSVWISTAAVSVIKLKRFPDITAALYFIFGMISCIFSNIYWLVHSIMRPDVRMPFAANEIAEYAMFLLFASSLVKLFHSEKRSVAPIIVTALFAATNVALWIAWTGEFVKDILCGLILGYYLCTVSSSLENNEALSEAERISVAAVSWVIILFQTAIFFVKPPLTVVFDTICYTLLFAGILFWSVKTIRSIKMKNAGKSAALAYAMFSWCVITMYMSAEPMYFAASFLTCLSAPLIYLALMMKEGEK